MILETPIGRLPTAPHGWALRAGHSMGAAEIVLAARAAFSRGMHGGIDALKRPHQSLKRPQKNLDNATSVLLDPTTRLVLFADQTFLIQCKDRTLPFAWGPEDTRTNAAQAITATQWARAHLSAWNALAKADWTLAPSVPQAMPTSFACPLWLEVDGWSGNADRLLPAITALIDSVALHHAPESRGWTMDIHNGVLKPTGFEPGFLIYDTHNTAIGQGHSLGLTGRVQNAVRADGRLQRLLGSHHLLVHGHARGSDQQPTCGKHAVVASFQVGASSAHQRLAGLAALDSLLKALP